MKITCLEITNEMKVIVTSKRNFNYIMERNGITSDNVEAHHKTFFISINSEVGTGQDENPYFESDKENVKVLFFDDVVVDKYLPGLDGEQIKISAITELQASELFQFIKKHNDKTTCVIHCTEGKSRSGAIGLFIVEYLGLDLAEFQKANPQVVKPNKLVLELLRKSESI